jgi:hypothetical protein
MLCYVGWDGMRTGKHVRFDYVQAYSPKPIYADNIPLLLRYFLEQQLLIEHTIHGYTHLKRSLLQVSGFSMPKYYSNKHD